MNLPSMVEGKICELLSAAIYHRECQHLQFWYVQHRSDPWEAILLITVFEFERKLGKLWKQPEESNEARTLTLTVSVGDSRVKHDV
ncbi:hypothetical protein BHE90_017661, partial [Fusarium euwallaceae]